jgi:hypothetical protein
MTSRYSPYSNLVFRQVFNSESDVIANGGTPTNLSFINGLIPFAQAYSGVLSVEDLTQIWSSTRGKIR